VAPGPGSVAVIGKARKAPGKKAPAPPKRTAKKATKSRRRRRRPPRSGLGRPSLRSTKPSVGPLVDESGSATTPPLQDDSPSPVREDALDGDPHVEVPRAVGQGHAHLLGLGQDDVLVAVTGTTIEDGQCCGVVPVDHLGSIGLGAVLLETAATLPTPRHASCTRPPGGTVDTVGTPGPLAWKSSNVCSRRCIPRSPLRVHLSSAFSPPPNPNYGTAST
jgi:hypothetical protein